MVRRLRPWMVALLVEGRGMWRIEGLGRWVTWASELPGALTRTNSHARCATRTRASIQRAFSRCNPSLHDSLRDGVALTLSAARLASLRTSPSVASTSAVRRAHERIKAAASPKHPRITHPATSYDVLYGDREW